MLYLQIGLVFNEFLRGSVEETNVRIGANHSLEQKNTENNISQNVQV